MRSRERDAGVAAALLGDALARVHEHDGEVGGGGAGDHVAGVLDVAGGVGNDEPPARRGEVAVGDVNGDALLAFGAEAVGEGGEVDRPPPVRSAERSSASIWSSISDWES